MARDGVSARMTIWRPVQTIRFKALGLHWRDDALLAAEVLNDDGSLKGVRPLGGTVEFGETAEETLVREFQEELGIPVIPQGAPFFLENIYEHEGAAGHEILALFEVVFPAGAFRGQTRLTFVEDNGTPCAAEWFPLDGLDGPGQPRLFPSGLKDYLYSAGLSPRG